MIALKHIYKVFDTPKGNVHACKDVNLEINDGEIFGIIGFSGAGKSTLVRCINLLERPTSGEVIINNQDITKLNAKELRDVRRKIGMIFQHFNLMRSRTVADNVAFSLKNSHLSKEEKNKRVEELLALVDLSDKKDAYPSSLSGGQKQRVAIARALANHPDILLCDEATSALDPQTTYSILKLLKEVNQKLNITIVLITHEMAVIKEICQRVAVMESGEVKEVGNVVDIFSNPQAQITKDFVSSASSINRIYELIEQKSPLVKIHDNEQMVRLTYDSNTTSMPLIYELSQKFGVKANIIFGNIEVIDDNPLGNLIVILSGEGDTIAKAKEYIISQGVRIEVIEA